MHVGHPVERDEGEAVLLLQDHHRLIVHCVGSLHIKDSRRSVESPGKVKSVGDNSVHCNWS